MIIRTGMADAPWGPVRVAAGEHGIVAIEQLLTAEEFNARLARRFVTAALGPTGDPGAAGDPGGSGERDDSGGPGDPGAAARHLQAALTALRAFFDGDLGALDALPLDLGGRSEWDRRVLGAVRELRPGTTASYGDVARMIGKPGAARAVGGSVGRNPIGLAIPCHRVIAGDGTLGGYGGGWWGGRQAGLELKRELLAREGVSLDR